MQSVAQRIASLPSHMQARLFADLSPETIDALQYEWRMWARPDQLPPPGDWRTWLLLAGRGAGKTRSSAEWVREQAESGKRRQIGIVGPTSDALRRIQVEGPSGVLAVCPPHFRPSYEPSTRRITWENGYVAHLFSGEEPDRIRGANLDAAWVDEIITFADPQAAWDMLQLALRIVGPQGHAPQVLVSTTPRPLPVLKAIIAASSTKITRAKTSDNAGNLDASTLAYLNERYGGTTLGRAELDGEMLEDAEGALWTRKIIDHGRVASAPDLRRIVVAVDPAGGSGPTNAETGIVVAGIDADKQGAYVLADLSDRYTPERWARRAIDAYYIHRADRIVCERNFGGEMVENTIRAVDPRVPITMVQASRGKVVRAEPVVALYEQRRVHHVGHLPTLEDQMCQWEPDSNMPSPDRLDALVWAISELSLGVQPQGARFVNFNLIGARLGGTRIPNFSR